MDNRPPLSATRPLPPQRAASGSVLQFSRPSTRPSLPSRLSNVRSVSQPGNLVDLTLDIPQAAGGSHAPFLREQEKVYTSPDVIEVEDEDGEPPAKRAKIAGDGLRAEADRPAERADMAHRIIAGEQLPSLPKTSTPNTRNPAGRRRRYGGESAARRANGIDPPPLATRLPPPKNVADFSPWLGNHQEDVLSETAVKSGYCDKGPAQTQNECSSAKPSIWPNLSSKNNMGLSTLSYLFTQVMEKRQALGRCTAPSTFKPPPRVTVTDTKREAWLRDLANPDVPLRKQSRTIPHGIRGKLLMDQCLGKDIPLQRAVWLAKCVGANELRAFRRKGISGTAAASGESKWVREWTVAVEQFVEGVIAMCGQEEWQLKMNYAVKLATSFYAEKLLDLDHYLDWIVSSFVEASVERMPVWIIMVQIYWKDLVRFNRRGKRLALSVLERLHAFTTSGLEVNSMLKTRLEKMVAVLAVTNRGCLILPQTWETYKYLLTPASTPREDGMNEDAARNLAKRNERLWAPIHKSPANTTSPLLDLYAVLDSVGLNVDIRVLTGQCVSLVPDYTQLLPALLDWASSLYRHGVSRVYLAARLVDELNAAGHDTDSIIPEYLMGFDRRPALRVDNIYRVVAELVRLDSFSVGRYLQWLISTGAMFAGEGARYATEVLAALPIAGLAPNVVNLQKTLMERLDHDGSLRNRVAGVLTDVENTLTARSLDTDQALQFSAEVVVSTQLVVAEHVREHIKATRNSVNLDLERFCVLRDILERVWDVSALAELCDWAIGIELPSLLAAVADTVNIHAESLSALGMLRSMMDRIAEQYRNLRSSQALDRSLVLALTLLGKRFPDEGALTSLLAADLVLCEQQYSLAVCSPASDSLTNMQVTSLDSDNDIDAVFASGNSVDEALMQRVFMRIAQRGTKADALEAQAFERICGWLNQLRVLNGSAFEQLLRHFTRASFRSAAQGPFPSEMMIALVVSSCLDVTVVVDAANEAGSSSAVTIALRLLMDSALISKLHLRHRYRYCVVQQRYCAEHAETLIPMMCRAFESGHFAVDNAASTGLLLQYVMHQPSAVRASFKQISESGVHANAGLIMQALLKRCSGRPTSESLDAAGIVSLATPLSVGICAGALEFVKNSQSAGVPDLDKVVNDLLVETVTNANPVWPRLVEVASVTTKKMLHAWAQDRLLHIATSSDCNERKHRDVFLDLLDVTSTAAEGEDDTALLVTVTNSLREIEKQLTKLDQAEALERHELLALRENLLSLIHICALHVQPSSSQTDNNGSARSNLVSVLCSLLVHQRVQTQNDLCEYLYDLAAALADRLLEAALGPIARSNPVAALDTRVQSILGVTSNVADAWLALASQMQPHGSQQQRILSRQPSQQAAVPGRVGIQMQSPGAGPSQQSQQRVWPHAVNRGAVELKTTPYPLRRWEIMPDATPMMGENDTSLSLGLFGARKAS